jgi:acetolactate decarboxylase
MYRFRIKTFLFPIVVLFVIGSGILNICKSTRSYSVQSAKNSAADPDFMYQYSIIDALMAGVFDGDLTIGNLKEKGDFGIGTFNKVDGELMMHQGRVYKISYDGGVQEVSDKDSTSAAFIKFFKTDTTIYLTEKALTYEKIQAYLSEKLNPNEIYALRITGVFETMTTRAARPAHYPYTTLSDHLKVNQAVFNLKATSGVCNGFLLPPYLARTNVPGFHMHYISDNLKEGGHVFNFTTDAVKIEIDKAKGFVIENNTNAEFGKVNLKPDRGAELKRIE